MVELLCNEHLVFNKWLIGKPWSALHIGGRAPNWFLPAVERVARLLG
jgi:hypothetical protein